MYFCSRIPYLLEYSPSLEYNHIPSTIVRFTILCTHKKDKNRQILILWTGSKFCDFDCGGNENLQYLSETEKEDSSFFTYCKFYDKTLPTEVQWEFAASERGKKKNQLFYWGNDLLVNDEYMCNTWASGYPKIIGSQDGFKYDSFILIRPDGIFQTIPDITKKQALISLFKEVSKKKQNSLTYRGKDYKG